MTPGGWDLVLRTAAEAEEFAGAQVSSSPGGTSGVDADAALAAVTRCPAFRTADRSGTTVNVRVSPLTVPRIGDASGGFRLVVEESGFTDVVLVRVGHHGFLGTHVTPKAADGASLPLGLVREAIAALNR